jgi:hypothetical protein
MGDPTDKVDMANIQKVSKYYQNLMISWNYIVISCKYNLNDQPTGSETVTFGLVLGDDVTLWCDLVWTFACSWFQPCVRMTDFQTDCEHLWVINIVEMVTGSRVWRCATSAGSAQVEARPPQDQRHAGVHTCRVFQVLINYRYAFYRYHMRCNSVQIINRWLSLPRILVTNGSLKVWSLPTPLHQTRALQIGSSSLCASFSSATSSEC